MKNIYGGIGLVCIIGFIWMIFAAFQVPADQQARRLTLLGLALAFALAGRVAFLRGKGR